MLLLSHPTGNANVRAVAHALYSRGLLSEFHSTICWNPDSFIARNIPESWKLLLNRRSFASVPQQYLHSHPWREIARLLSSDLPVLHRHESGLLSIDRLLRSFDSRIARRIRHSESFMGVYAYEDSARLTFEAAKSKGLKCFYDLPIGYWRAARRIYEEEHELNPDWTPTLTGLLDSKSKLESKDYELSLADVVLVASSFVKSTLGETSAITAPIVTIPYGAPPVSETKDFDLPHKPLRVLYVGSLGQRKGLSYLLDAVAMAQFPISLTLIGQPTAPDCLPLRKALDSHTWIPSLAHKEILEQMRNHHVLVFPTLFDGFGLVILEALSQGLPVISTPNSGAPECIRHGKEGFIVPVRDSYAIASCLERLSNNPDLLYQMRQSCFLRAKTLQWSDYEEQLVSTIKQYLD